MNRKKYNTQFNKKDAQRRYREYKTYYYESNNGRKYDKEQIRKFLERPQYYEKQLREVSLYLSSTSSHYLRMVYYLSTMLTLDHILIPNWNNLIDEQEIINYFNKANLYINKFNIKHELLKIIPTIIIEDTFFGYESKDKNVSTIRKLPSNYCKIVGIDDGIFVFTFDFTYFNGREHLLRDYPKEFRRLYIEYRKTGIGEQELNPNLGAICFKFRDDLTYNFPFLAPLFEELIELEDKKDMANNKELLSQYKLLVQKIPLRKDAKSEKDMLFDPKSVQIFHQNLSDSVPDRVSVVTSPMDIEELSLTGKTSLDDANLSDAQEILFTSAGFGNIFNSKNKGDASSKFANISDQSLMFKLLRQFERFFNSRLKKELCNKNIITIMFPDLTYFNRSKMKEEYLKLSQYGYPKSLVAISSGMSQDQFLGLNKLENYLEIEKKLIPLSSAHTQSSSEIGRPEKDI